MIASARGWLAGLFLLCGLASAVAAGDFPPTAAFSDIRVDVRPLREAGAGGQADALAADLTAALRKTFAGRIGGRGPRLVVVVKALSLRPYVGGGARRGAAAISRPIIWRARRSSWRATGRCSGAIRR